jgi:hypothetical protein
MEAPSLQLSTESRLHSLRNVIPQLKSIALELFDSVSVDFDIDPETDAHYLVVRVRAFGEIPEISARRSEWHRRVHPFLQENHDLVHLDIDAR